MYVTVHARNQPWNKWDFVFVRLVLMCWVWWPYSVAGVGHLKQYVVVPCHRLLCVEAGVHSCLQVARVGLGWQRLAVLARCWPWSVSCDGELSYVAGLWLPLVVRGRIPSNVRCNEVPPVGNVAVPGRTR